MPNMKGELRRKTPCSGCAQSWASRIQLHTCWHAGALTSPVLEEDSCRTGSIGVSPPRLSPGSQHDPTCRRHDHWAATGRLNIFRNQANSRARRSFPVYGEISLQASVDTGLGCNSACAGRLPYLSSSFSIVIWMIPLQCRNRSNYQLMHNVKQNVQSRQFLFFLTDLFLKKVQEAVCDRFWSSILPHCPHECGIWWATVSGTVSIGFWLGSPNQTNPGILDRNCFATLNFCFAAGNMAT